MNPYLSETELASFFDSRGDAYLAAHCRPGLAGEGEHTIYYELYRADISPISSSPDRAGFEKKPDTAPCCIQGVLVLCHGFCESAAKYRELIYYFLQHGYHVLCYDARGHGRSFREVCENSKVHIDYFDRYIEDLELLMQTLILPEFSTLPLYLFGHSMGGCVAVRYLETYPGHFRRCILSSPMLELRAAGLPQTLAGFIAGFCRLIGKGRAYVPGHGDFDAGEDFADSAASSEARFQLYQTLRKSTAAFQSNGADYDWLLAALRGGRQARKTENVRRITIPILLFEADYDSYVEVNRYSRFCRLLPDVEYHKIPGTRHEIYNSPDSVIQRYYDWIFRFLKQQ